MGKLRVYRSPIAFFTAAMMMFLPLPYGEAQAAMISTEQVVTAPTRTADEARAHVLGLIQRTEVQAEMQALGVDPAEVIERVNAMSDSEIKDIAGKIDSLPAGGGSYQLTVAAQAVILGVALAFALLVALLVHLLQNMHGVEEDEVDDTSPTSSGETPSKEMGSRKPRTEIERYWRERIEAVKREGPYKDCELAVESPGRDPASFTDCEERGVKVEFLRKEMAHELASWR